MNPTPLGRSARARLVSLAGGVLLNATPGDAGAEEQPPAESAIPSVEASPAEPPEAPPEEDTRPVDPWASPDVDAWLREQGVEAESTRETVRFNVGGFADVDLHGSSSGGHGHNEFHIGQLVFHGLADLTRGFGAFMEVSVNSEPKWETRVERLLLFWELNDNLKLSMGRHHIPVTWWNSTFHHGLWLQTTARRPVIVGYNDAFVPNHAVGLNAEGKVPGLESLGFRYQLGLNGGGDDHLHSGTATTHHAELRAAWTAGLFLEPPALPRLRLGAVVFADPLRHREGRLVDELTVGAHVAYTSEQPELIAEVVHVRHDVGALEDGTGAGAFSHWAWYVQAAWRLPGAASAFKPYARYEALTLDPTGDPTLASASGTRLFLAGTRIDATPWLALKVEGAWRHRDGTDDTLEALVQASAAW